MISRNTAVNHGPVSAHRHWKSTCATVLSRLSSTGRNAIEETTTSSVMVTAQTTMQYGHNAPMRYRLWKISHCTNATPTRIPAANPAQYHWGKDTFDTASTPVTTTTVKPTMPSSGLGKPTIDACGVTITEPHETVGVM